MKGSMLAEAIAFASVKHKFQFDKGGVPYILHTLKVMHYLKTDDQELMCIAVLHDVVEDCGVTFDELRELGMSERVTDGVAALTKMPGQTLDEYLTIIKANIDAIRVKLCDLHHNSDIRRLKGITDKDVARMRKYHTMYMELKELV